MGKKKVFWLITAAATVLALSVVMGILYAVGFTLRYQGIRYHIDDGEAVVIGVSRDKETYQIHDRVMFTKVTEISDEAFLDNSLVDIRLGAFITTVGQKAFYGCRKLESVQFSEGLIEIKEQAFSGAHSLSTILLPETLAFIGAYAFQDCRSLESVEIPDQVTAIYRGTFSECDSLLSVILPEGLLSIGDYAFNSCYALEEMLIPDSVIAVGSYAFYDCQALSSVVMPDTLSEIRPSTFADCLSLSELDIPSGVTIIGANAFENCASLSEVVFPETLTTIGKAAFDGAGNLTVISVPKSVTAIGDKAFANMTNLTAITVHPDNHTFLSIGGVLYDDEVSCLYAYPLGKEGTEFTIPETVTSIRPFAFAGDYQEVAEGLRIVTIKDSVATIGEAAFADSGLTIRVEATEKPDGWHFYWSEGADTVVWGYTEE